MTAGQVPRRLDVHADLRVEVDGAIATVSGAGSRIVVSSDEPMKLWAAANASALPDGFGTISGPRGIGDFADALDAVGLQVEIAGPDGTLVRLGAPADSRVARLLTGSRSVTFGSPRAVLPSAWSALRHAVDRRVLVAVAAAVIVPSTVAVVRSRRR